MKTSFQWTSFQKTLKNVRSFALDKLSKVKVGRFSEVIFTKNMFVEARCLAQIHLAFSIIQKLR